MLERLPAIEDLQEELDLVDKNIDVLLQTDTYDGSVADVFASVRSQRGKMIRPTLLLLAARFGRNYAGQLDRLCKLGALVEIVHMASLIHDDIIDDSPLRRGRISIQARFGKDVAVYAGDFLISRVMHCICVGGMTSSGVVIARTIEEMCRGEISQKSCRWDTETTIGSYIRNIYGKTAVLFKTAAQIGAAEGGADEQDVGCLRSIGKSLGYMFQLRDDLIDIVSDGHKQGKPVNRDFSQGIYTMPVLFAFGNHACGGRLREIAGMGAEEANYGKRLAEMRALVGGSGGLEFTWAKIDEYAAQVQRRISSLPRKSAALAIEQLVRLLSDSGGFAGNASIQIPKAAVV